MEVGRLFDQFERMQERATWRSVFGEPQVQAGATIIPLAQIVYGFGGGFGRGTGPSDESGVSVGGAGGGLGGRLSARPAGVVKITNEAVSIEPYIDRGKLILAALALVGWNTFWITKTVREVARVRASRRGPSF